MISKLSLIFICLVFTSCNLLMEVGSSLNPDTYNPTDTKPKPAEPEPEYTPDPGPDPLSPPLLQTFFTGATESPYNLTLYCGTLYMADWTSNTLTTASLLATGEVDYTTEYNLVNAVGIHGITVDESNGFIWACDLDGRSLVQYTSYPEFSWSNFYTFSTNAQPVGVVAYGEKLYVADRYYDVVYQVDKSGLVLETEYSLDAMSPAEAGSYVDLFAYCDKLYIVADEMRGITEIDLMKHTQRQIYLSGREELSAMGIFIFDGTIFLNTGDEVVLADLNGNILGSWGIQRPDGFHGRYTDIVYADSLVYLSSYSGSGGEPGMSHILIYGLNQAGQQR